MTGEVHSARASQVATWFLDSDYDRRTFHICQVSNVGRHVTGRFHHLFISNQEGATVFGCPAIVRLVRWLIAIALLFRWTIAINFRRPGVKAASNGRPDV